MRIVERLGLAASLLLSLVAAPVAQAKAPPPLRWEPFGAEAFARAARQHRLVLLELAAEWCHWCHVMDETTWRDPAVRSLVAARFVAVRVDEESRPDLAARYQRYGWPGIIVLSPEGVEIVKRRGYREPAEMVALLRAVLDDPSPEEDEEAGSDSAPSAGAGAGAGGAGGALDEARRQALLGAYLARFDAVNAGWGRVHQLVHAEPLEWALDGAAPTGPLLEMARRTLDAGLRLFDPVWGGVYQYSDALDWSSPHFEKIAWVQTDALRIYSLAALRFGDARYLEAARSVARYVGEFLVERGGADASALHGTQDADLGPGVTGHDYYRLDDAARRKLGTPRIDPHLYARDSGLLAGGLLALFAASGDASTLALARGALDWALARRALPSEETPLGSACGFRHDERDAAGPYLADTLAVGQALLDLYQVTAERAQLSRAECALRFVERHFRDARGGYFTAPSPDGAKGALAAPHRDLDENIALARLAVRLHHATGAPLWRAVAERAVAFAAGASASRPFFPGLQVADRELSTAPLHLTIVGAKGDPRAAALFAAALRAPRGYKRVEWWDRSEGPPPNADVQYPTLARPAAFSCSGRACSAPVFDPARLPETIARVLEQ